MLWRVNLARFVLFIPEMLVFRLCSMKAIRNMVRDLHTRMPSEWDL